ncbi:immunoglobulin-like domain-containing protein [Adhaeribacter terreus]|uniref:Immunoglobulin-like domain-containing protein n=1 Tax=Adhaeribacter terreus TaxID=529703 RepID=A0ABW0ECX4_9BACT
MKKNSLKYFFLLFALPFLFSCERDLETEGISRITNYPVFNMPGDQFLSVEVGGTFNDPGVTATEGGAEIPVTKTGDVVDTSTPGVYIMNYTATNKDGYSASTTRYVGVIAPDAAAADLSGNYKRNAGVFGVSKVTKVGVGHYTTDNVGGVAVGGPATSLHFYHTTGNTLVGPEQNNGTGVFEVVDATYSPAAGATPASYTWTVINPGYGNAPRTFVKQ